MPDLPRQDRQTAGLPRQDRQIADLSQQDRLIADLSQQDRLIADLSQQDRLIAGLAADLRPVERLAPAWKRQSVWMLAAIWVGLLLSLFVSWPTLWMRLTAVWDMWMSPLGAVLTAVLAAFAAFKTSIPGNAARWALLPLPALALWVGSSTAGCMRLTPINGTMPEPADHPILCLEFLILVSLPLCVLLTWQLMRACPLRPGLTASLGGLASAGAAAVLLTLIHPFDATVADLGLHAVAVAVVVVGMRVFGGAVLGRSERRKAFFFLMHIAIIGAGPAALIAAERLAPTCQVTLFDQMASPARKFLLAGRGGLNLTHSETFDTFVARYGAASAWMEPMLRDFPPSALIAWCEGLGQAVFTGSSGRVFPRAMKAAPLLRAWLRRLETLGVRFCPRHRWLGWTDDGALRLAAPGGEIAVRPDATVLALGGASWPRMGSDGGWVGLLRARGVAVADLRAANCGVRIGWSEIFRARFEGAPLKRIALSLGAHGVRGEAVITRDGLEGGALYALSAPIRAALDAGAAVLRLDMRPDMSTAEVAMRVDGARGGRSLPNFLRQAVGLAPVAIGLVQEALHAGTDAKLSVLIKALPLRVAGMQPIGRAISSSGGIRLDELDDYLMLKRLPGVFAAGEMLDWEAPTGGYLLQGCFATGYRVGEGLLFLKKKKQKNFCAFGRDCRESRA